MPTIHQTRKDPLRCAGWDLTVFCKQEGTGHISRHLAPSSCFLLFFLSYFFPSIFISILTRKSLQLTVDTKMQMKYYPCIFLIEVNFTSLTWCSFGGFQQTLTIRERFVFSLVSPLASVLYHPYSW